MKRNLFQFLSKFNKAVLPKVWDTADLSDLSKKEKLILGWKRWVTFQYLKEKEKSGASKPKGGVY